MGNLLTDRGSGLGWSQLEEEETADWRSEVRMVLASGFSGTCVELHALYSAGPSRASCNHLSSLILGTDSCWGVGFWFLGKKEYIFSSIQRRCLDHKTRTVMR
jgi:hypothetical protein